MKDRQLFLDKFSETVSTLTEKIDVISREITELKENETNGPQQPEVQAESNEPTPYDYNGVIHIDKSGIIISAEMKLLSLFGYSTEDVRGKSFCDFIPSHMHPFLQSDWAALVEKKELIKVNILHKRGFEVPIHLTVADDNNGKHNFYLYIKDASYRKEIEEELFISRENYQILAETATDAIIQLNSDFKITFVNSAIEKIFGYKRIEIENKPLKKLFPDSRYLEYESMFLKYFYIDEQHRKETGLASSMEVLGKRKNHELIPLEISFGNTKGAQNKQKLTCIIRDIAFRKKTERHLKFLAYHDQLTSLGNRDRMMESLDQVILEIKRRGNRKAALLFCDLDGFKKVNDSLGHEMGDTILKECSNRLINCLRKGDQVYRIQVEDVFRLGGDEFTILLPFIKNPEDAAIVAKRIIDRIVEPFHIEGYGSISHVNMGVSIGIALIPEDGLTRGEILRNADAAMYKAKELGNQYVFFKNEMNNRAVERLFMEEGLRKSIGSNLFSLFYQPIVQESAKIIGFEALIRWNHEKRGFIPPNQFISVAEDTGLILPIGRWVLETACRNIRTWLSNGFDNFYISVNISPKQLEQQNLGMIIQEITNKFRIDPKYLTLELTETCIMRNPDTAIQKMNDIIEKNPGIRIAIDDFGTGYSSLSYLSRFPVKNLKIDQSFVLNLNEENNKKIINAIINLGESLGLTIIAEGVETEEHKNYLRERNCDLFQGYFFDKPMPFKEATSRLMLKKEN